MISGQDKIEGVEKSVKKSKSRKEKISLKDKIIIITTVLQIFITGGMVLHLFSIENSFNHQLETSITEINNQITSSQEIMNNKIELVQQTINSGDVTTNNYASVIDETTDEETLLNYADNAFSAGDYEAVVKILSFEKLKNNPRALYKLGYMYANGYYFPVNIGMADALYDNAYAKGMTIALSSKLALHMRYQENCIDILEEALRSNNVVIINFFAMHYEEFELYDYDKGIYRNLLEDFLKNKSEEEQWAEITSDKFYYLEDQGLVTLYSVPSSTAIERYEYIRSGEEGSFEEGYVTYRIYEKYVNKCTYSAYLFEDFFY